MFCFQVVDKLREADIRSLKGDVHTIFELWEYDIREF